jgi:hypothetical protein
VAGIRRILTFAAALAAWLPAAAAAQAAPGVDVFAGVERLEYRYRFHNDSSFDTSFLVPHFFEQRYERTAPLFGARGRYTFLSRPMTTEVSLVVEREAFGSDFDTFFQPGGDRATSGTAGGVDLASLRVEHVARVFAAEMFHAGVVVAWRRDRADFRPADRVVTHTRPPSETREFTTDRERTVSQTFEVGVEGAVATLLDDGEKWLLEARARLMPAVRARLLTELPDKYPGRDIVFTALGWSGSGTITVTRQFGGAAAAVWIGIEQAGEYRDTAQFERTAVTAGGSIAFGSRR